jgi:hypothetical protein
LLPDTGKVGKVFFPDVKSFNPPPFAGKNGFDRPAASVYVLDIRPPRRFQAYRY